MNQRDSELFQVLIVQLAQGAWVALGKVPNPISGKIESNLEVARMTIDMLSSLETRTAGNLSDDEMKVLDRALRDLRLNYVDEQKKAAEPAPEAQAGDEPRDEPSPALESNPPAEPTPGS